MLWDKAIRCVEVFSHRTVKSIFVENVLPSIRSKVRNCLTSHPYIGLSALARYVDSYGDTHRATKQKATHTDSLPFHRRITSYCLMSLRTDLAEYECVMGVGQVLAMGDGIILPFLPTTRTITASNSSRVNQFTTPSRGANTTSVQLMDKPCRICHFQEPDCCQMLLLDIYATMLATRETSFNLRKQKVYYRLARSTAVPSSSYEPRRCSMAHRQVFPQAQAVPNNRSGNTGALVYLFPLVDAEKLRNPEHFP